MGAEIGFSVSVEEMWVERHINLRVGKNAVVLLLSQIGVRALALFFNAHLGRTLGVEALGRYITMLALEGLTLAFISLGLNIYATRELSRCQTDEETASLLSTFLSLRLITGLLGTVLLNAVVAPFFYDQPYRVLIAIVSLALIPDAMIGPISALVRARQRMEISSGIEFSSRLVAVLGGLFALWQDFDEAWAVGAYTVGRFVAMIMLLGILWRWHLRVRVRFNASWKSLLRACLPFALTDILAILYRKFDVLILPGWHGDIAAGIYGAAYNLWENLGLIPSSFLEALFPEMSRRTRAGNAVQLIPLYRRTRQILFLLVVLMVVSFIMLTPVVFRTLYGDMTGRVQAANIFRWLLLGLPFTYLYLLDGNVLYALDRQHAVTRWMFVVTLLNVVLNLIFIPRWGVWAAASIALFSAVCLYLALHHETIQVINQHELKVQNGS